MPTVAETAERLVELLTGRTAELSDPNGSDLDFFASIEPKPLERLTAPPDCWAVDGGQALVADARCLQVAVTRAARTRWQDGQCALEEQGEFTAHILRGSGGGPEAKYSLAAMGAPVEERAPVDLNVLRDWAEWRLVSRSVDEAEPGRPSPGRWRPTAGLEDPRPLAVRPARQGRRARGRPRRCHEAQFPGSRRCTPGGTARTGGSGRPRATYLLVGTNSVAAHRDRAWAPGGGGPPRP